MVFLDLDALKSHKIQLPSTRFKGGFVKWLFYEGIV